MPVVSALFAQMDFRKQKIVLCSTSGIVLYLIYIVFDLRFVAVQLIFGIGADTTIGGYAQPFFKVCARSWRERVSRFNDFNIFHA